MLGGSGSHNDNVYNRGSPHDYNNFAKLTGDQTWEYRNVLKYFKKLENYEGRLVNESERFGRHEIISEIMGTVIYTVF